MQDLVRFVDQCRVAATCIDSARPREAVEILRRLMAVRPGAVWLTEACRSAEQAAGGLEHIRSGPLGLTPRTPKPAEVRSIALPFLTPHRSEYFVNVSLSMPNASTMRSLKCGETAFTRGKAPPMHFTDSGCSAAQL